MLISPGLFAQTAEWSGSTPGNIYYSSGNVGIGTGSPESKFHISYGNHGVKTQYGVGIIEAGDAHLDIISSSDATWGSTINLVEGNGSSNTDVWSISRQTTGGSGNSSLRFNFGTSNNHTNQNKLTLNSNGNIGIGNANPLRKLSVYINTTETGNDWLFELYRDAGSGISENRGTGMYFRDQNSIQAGIVADRLASSSHYRSDLVFYTNSNISGTDISTSITEKMRITYSGDVGIGTTDPIEKLHIDDGALQFLNMGAQDNVNLIKFSENTGTPDEFSIQGMFNDSGAGGNAIKFRSTWNDNLLVIRGNGEIGIGTTVTGPHKLAVEGSIGAREVKVESTTWSDFVFREDYELMSINEVENYIRENKHLPNIPTESQVKDEGINLGEMDAKLLQKIEELTLYVIELKQEIDQLKAENHD